MAGAKGWSSRGLRLAVLVIMMLATIGAWEIVKMARQGGSAHADGVVADHLTCYDVRGLWHGKKKGVIDAGTRVLLRDQFFPSGVEVEVEQLRAVCTAAVKTKL
jgi:hypothetical protein